MTQPAPGRVGPTIRNRDSPAVAVASSTTVPDQWPQIYQKMSAPITGAQCILLSFFSGIEVATLAVQELIGPVLLHLTWEIDTECQSIISWHFPQARHRGDVLQEDADQIIALINKHDPHETCLVLFCSSPPCPDFSSISSSAQGLTGKEGSKFTAYTSLSNKIEAGLGNRQTRYLVENVVMNKPEADFITSMRTPRIRWWVSGG